jgi:hypothetical protein
MAARTARVSATRSGPTARVAWWTRTIRSSSCPHWRRLGPWSRAGRRCAAGARTPMRCIRDPGFCGRWCRSVGVARSPSAWRRRPVPSGRGSVARGMDQPTTCRVNTSSTARQYTFPALDQVLVHGRLRSVPPLVPVRNPALADQPHQPGHPFTADPDPHPEAQLGVHLRRAVGAARHRVHVDDGDGQVGVLEVTPGRWPGPPLVVPRPRQVQHPAGHRDVDPVRGELSDQPEPYLVARSPG